ncbi:MAG TPA: hypothetical protein VM557_01755 [Thermoanaerobaculia bacterium]|nr:hypothetical protein [Thermoanaerobaculia bacterium]
MLSTGLPSGEALPAGMALLFLVCAACAPLPGSAGTGAVSQPAISEVTLTAEKRETESVRLTLTNHSNDAVGYNLCTSSVVRRSGNSWIEVPTRLICTMEFRTLRPGQTDSFPYPVPEGLPSGEYAWRNNIEFPLGDGERLEILSNSLQLP